VDTVTPTTPLGLLAQLGAGAPVLQPGQIVEAVVLALLENDSVRLGLPNATLDVRSTVPLTVGATIQLAVKSTGSGLQLVMLPTNGNAPSVATLASGAQVVADTFQTGLPQPAPASAGLSGVLQPAVEISIRGVSIQLADMPSSVAPAQAAIGVNPVAVAVQVAAARQGGLAPLMADLEALLGQGPASLPAPVLVAAAQLLALRLPLDANLSAADVKQALNQSGLFLEARLAPLSAAATASTGSVSGNAAAPLTVLGGDVATASSTSSLLSASADLASVGSDLKAALLVFRQVVQLWADQATTAAQASTPAVPNPVVARAAPLPLPLPSTNPLDGLASPTAVVASTPITPPPPPYRGGQPASQPVAMASISGTAAAGEVATHLLTQADAALARHTLLQVASLPSGGISTDQHRTDHQGPQWTFEVPFMTPAGTSIAQFEIGRDDHAVSADGQRTWRARFSVDIEPMGPVHAQVTLMGSRAAVTLWAERDQSAAQLRESAPLLTEALKAAAFEPGDIQCRTGAPVMPRSAVPAAGWFLDRAS